MFLHVSVILSTGGREGVLQAGRTPPPHPRLGEPPWLGEPPPGTRQTPPVGRTPPGPGRPPSPPAGRPPPGPGRLQNTVYERPVRILLECILVFNVFRPIMALSPSFCEAMCSRGRICSTDFDSLLHFTLK